MHNLNKSQFKSYILGNPDLGDWLPGDDYHDDYIPLETMPKKAS